MVRKYFLARGLMSIVTKIDSSVLKAIAPYAPAKKAGAQAAIIRNFGEMLPELLSSAAITTVLRIPHYLAQVGHESDGFCALEEYASGAAYEGRVDLGNVRTGDGVRFKGRGPIQLTGRDNYRAFTTGMRRRRPDCPDFEAQPELIATWPWAGWATVFFWETKSCNAAADRDDLVAVTKIINGGRNGLTDRANYLAKAKTAIARIAGDQLSGNQRYPVLVRGMFGEPVEAVQRALQAAGHYLLSIDGIFGPGMEAAVKTFQRTRGLTVDGIVGANTAAALSPYMGKAD
jgi:putative chitinase